MSAEEYGALCSEDKIKCKELEESKLEKEYVFRLVVNKEGKFSAKAC